MDLAYEDTTTMNALHRIRHPWRIAAITLAAIVIVLAALAAAVPFRSETARRKVVEVLAARLDAEVELADLRLRVLPWFRAEGHGLVIRHKGRRDVPPLIAIERFSADGNPLDLLRKHIARVTVEGLTSRFRLITTATILRATRHPLRRRPTGTLRTLHRGPSSSMNCCRREPAW